VDSGGIERSERLLALHHALRLNRRITAGHPGSREPPDRAGYPLSLHERDQRLLAESLEPVAAAAEAEAAPPWWCATVVGHELRHPDIAVLRIRPHQPYPYRSGQFTTVEPPHLPRMWRPYSMATAPGDDGVLEFHVRAVPDGTVSGTLVHKTAIGDELRIGPPIGTSVLDPDSRRDLLLVSGGTGLAPLKALVAELAQASRRDRRWVRWFIGARQSGDLYDVGSLRQMAATYPWLSIMFVVSDDGSYPGEQGLVTDVFCRYGDWRDHDVYLAGPPGMVRASLDRLGRLGVPRERIRWDAHGELAEVS
jgi:NAD(P)H-flavin reductase